MLPGENCSFFEMNEPSNAVTYEEGGSLQEDEDARDLLLRFGTEYQNTTPVQSTGNGSCLFDSLSTALTGHGGHAKELRLQTAIELIINEIYCKGLYRQDVKWHCLNTSYEEAIQLCLNSGETAGWTIHATSTVLRCPIKSMYPAVNGPKDPAVIKLANIFEPHLKGR